MARPASDIKARVIQAARERFLTLGVDGASLRHIAKDAETSIGMVYYYFKTKDELFLAVVLDVYEGLLTDIARLLGGDEPEEERFTALYRRLAQLSEEEFQVLRLVLREALVSSTRLTELGQLFIRGHVPVVLGCIVQGIAKQRLRGDLPPVILLASSLLLGIMPQIARRLLDSIALPAVSLLPTPDAIAHGMAAILFHGIAREAMPLTAAHVSDEPKDAPDRT
jgi:AcrR family transcriptional regulator